MILIVILLNLSCSCADPYIRVLIPSDVRAEDIYEIKFDNMASQPGGTPVGTFTLYYYHRPGDEIAEFTGKPNIPIVEAYLTVCGQMESILSSVFSPEQYTIVYDYYQPNKDTCDGAYYQFNVINNRTEKQVFIFFVDAMTGDFLTKPLFENLSH